MYLQATAACCVSARAKRHPRLGVRDPLRAARHDITLLLGLPAFEDSLAALLAAMLIALSVFEVLLQVVLDGIHVPASNRYDLFFHVVFVQHHQPRLLAIRVGHLEVGERVGVLRDELLHQRVRLELSLTHVEPRVVEARARDQRRVAAAAAVALEARGQRRYGAQAVARAACQAVAKAEAEALRRVDFSGPWSEQREEN